VSRQGLNAGAAGVYLQGSTSRCAVPPMAQTDGQAARSGRQARSTVWGRRQHPRRPGRRRRRGRRCLTAPGGSISLWPMGTRTRPDSSSKPTGRPRPHGESGHGRVDAGQTPDRRRRGGTVKRVDPRRRRILATFGIARRTPDRPRPRERLGQRRRPRPPRVWVRDVARLAVEAPHTRRAPSTSADSWNATRATTSRRRCAPRRPGSGAWPEAELRSVSLAHTDLAVRHRTCHHHRAIDGVGSLIGAEACHANGMPW